VAEASVSRLLTSDAFEKMANREQGVAGHHPGARVAHYLGDPFAHFGFVAVDSALGTGTPVFAEWTSVQTPLGIILELRAGGAQLTPARPVMGLAENADPDAYRLSLFFQ
jgi:hypothetical protein